jgi:hypothetical protein
MPVQLKIRDIRTGQAQIAEFESVDDTLTWLSQRPRFIDVLGPPQRSSLAADDDARMRAAMRTLDDEELAAQAEQDQRDAEAIRAAMTKEHAKAQEQLEALREQNRLADPNRLMHVTWERGQGCRNADPADHREVSELARAAVEAWVAERNTWVHPRGQSILDAQVMVWPGPVPGDDEDNRIEAGGQFNPVAGLDDDA